MVSRSVQAIRPAPKIDVTDKFISQGDESADVRKATYEESIGWYEGITSDMFSRLGAYKNLKGGFWEAALFFCLKASAFKKSGKFTYFGRARSMSQPIPSTITDCSPDGVSNTLVGDVALKKVIDSRPFRIGIDRCPATDRIFLLGVDWRPVRVKTMSLIKLPIAAFRVRSDSSCRRREPYRLPAGKTDLD